MTTKENAVPAIALQPAAAALAGAALTGSALTGSALTGAALAAGSALSRRTLAAQIYDQLEDRILSGSLPPGTKLSEEGLAESFGVSRAPVREALTALQSAGLTERCGVRDRIIVVPTPTMIAQKYDLWWIVDAGRTYIASLTASQPNLDALAELVAAMQQAVEAGNAPAYRTLVEAFHDKIRQGCDNPFLTEMGAGCDVHLRWFETLYDRNPEMSQAVVEEHRRIFMAYAARDFASLSEGIRVHMLRQRDRILSLFAAANGAAPKAGVLSA